MTETNLPAIESSGLTMSYLNDYEIVDAKARKMIQEWQDANFNWIKFDSTQVLYNGGLLTIGGTVKSGDKFTVKYNLSKLPLQNRASIELSDKTNLSFLNNPGVKTNYTIDLNKFTGFVNIHFPFTSNAVAYATIMFNGTFLVYQTADDVGTIAYQNGTWINNAYQTITISNKEYWEANPDVASQEQFKAWIGELPPVYEPSKAIVDAALGANQLTLKWIGEDTIKIDPFNICTISVKDAEKPDGKTITTLITCTPGNSEIVTPPGGGGGGDTPVPELTLKVGFSASNTEPPTQATRQRAFPIGSFPAWTMYNLVQEKSLGQETVYIWVYIPAEFAQGADGNDETKVNPVQNIYLFSSNEPVTMTTMPNNWYCSPESYFEENTRISRGFYFAIRRNG